MLQQDEDILCKALRYLVNLELRNCIVHMSLGVNYESSELNDLCKQIYDNGNVIVAAFDNTGTISYPACLEYVIGVEADERCVKRSDFICPYGEIVNVYAKGGFHRVSGIKDTYVIKQGNSMSAAYVTGFISLMELTCYSIEEVVHNLKILSTFNETKIQKNENNYFNERNYLTAEELKKVKKAGVFTYSKETSHFLRFSSMLNFDIVEIYTCKYFRNIRKIQNDCGKNTTILIKNIEQITNSNIDTLLIGHLNKLELILSNIKDIILEKCLENNINVFSLDSVKLSKYIEKFEEKGLFLRCPTIIKSNIKKKGKLYKIKTPVLGIFGTSSKQGKFTLQLELKKIFELKGYDVGYLSSEPTGVIFGADDIIPFGFEGLRNINDYEFIDLVNNQLHNIDIKNKDIIIAGSQSRTIPQETSHLGVMAIKQIEFLLALQPDAVLLCVNCSDDIEYIKRTILVIENIIKAKVIGLVIFPLGYSTGWKQQNDKFDEIPYNILTEIKKKYKIALGIETFVLNKDIDKIFKQVLDFY